MISKQHIFTIYNTFFLLFCVSIPFEDLANAIPNILLGILGFLFLFIIKKEDVLNLIKKRSFIFLIALTLFVPLNSLLKGFFFEDAFFFSKLIIPCLIIVLSLPIKNITRVKQAFVLGTVTAILLSSINIIEYVYINGGFEFSKGQFINDLLVSERLYIGFCSVLSLIFSIDIFKYSENRKIKTISLITCIIIILFVFLIVARIAVVSIIFVIILLIFTNFYWKKKLIASLSLVAFVVLFFVLNKNLSTRFFHTKDIHTESIIDRLMLREPRAIIWNCAFKIIKEDHNILFGNGFRKTKQQLVNCYGEDIEIDKKRDWFLETKFNTHNQFLDFYLGSGLIGFLLFLLVLYYLYYESSKKFLPISLLGSLILILLIDNILHRQIGEYLFSFIVVIIYNKRQHQ